MNKLRDGEIRKKYNIEVRNHYATLATEDFEQNSEDEIETEWNHMKTSMTFALEKSVPKKEKAKRKEWMNDEILRKMEERKRAKNDQEMYKLLDREVNIMCDKAKEAWINDNCLEIEELEAKHKTREMYEKVKEITATNQKKRGNSCVTSKDGRVLFDQQEIQDRWKEYIEELFDDKRGDIPEMDNLDGPVILKEEVRKAINSLRPGKAPGDDEITTEMLQALDEEGIDKVT